MPGEDSGLDRKMTFISQSKDLQIGKAVRKNGRGRDIFPWGKRKTRRAWSGKERDTAYLKIKGREEQQGRLQKKEVAIPALLE